MGSRDTVTDSHWVVVITLNEFLHTFNGTLRENGYEEYTVNQVQLLGTFTTESVNSEVSQRKEQTRLIVEQVALESGDAEWIPELIHTVEDIDELIDSTELFD